MTWGMTLYSLLTMATGFGGMALLSWWMETAYRRGYSNWLAIPVYAGLLLTVVLALGALMLFSVNIS